MEGLRVASLDCTHTATIHTGTCLIHIIHTTQACRHTVIRLVPGRPLDKSHVRSLGLSPGTGDVVALVVLYKFVQVIVSALARVICTLSIFQLERKVFTTRTPHEQTHAILVGSRSVPTFDGQVVHRSPCDAARRPCDRAGLVEALRGQSDAHRRHDEVTSRLPRCGKAMELV